ncbi:MAG: hypothetical protein ACLU37_09375 [Collinsella sp.]
MGAWLPSCVKMYLTPLKAAFQAAGRDEKAELYAPAHAAMEVLSAQALLHLFLGARRLRRCASSWSRGRFAPRALADAVLAITAHLPHCLLKRRVDGV